MKKTTKRLSAFLLACVMSIGLCPTSLAAGDTQEENTESAGGTTVADWKFEKNCTTGSIADATLNVLDASGNNNDLKMQLYTNSQPTTDVNAANWEDYLSFSENSMTGTGGSMVFNGDNGSVQSKTGADLITVETAPINRETFENGYTLEYLYYFPKDWTTADKWMSLMARQGSSSSISEPQQGTMFTSISNCKEVQFNTAPAADNHTMKDSAWSVTMDQGGVWYHIAVVSDGHEISTYINGCEAFRDYVSDDMKGMYADPADGRFRIGSSWWKEGSQTLDKFLQGSLQEVRISNAALQQNDWLISDPTKYAGNFGSNEPYKLKHSDNYNFVLLPDTQNTVEYRPDVMNTAIDELIDTADDLNVKAVVHLGDIVDDVTNEQYKNARDAFYRIPEAGIKLLAQLGNHDGWGNGIMNSYNGFSGKSSAWTSRTNWYLHFSPNGDKYSSYMFVQAGSYNYLIVSVSAIGGRTQWNPDDEAWLREVLNKYPNCPTIVTTHNMQSCSATAPDAIELSSDGKKIWDIVKDYDQVFMLVGGHHHGAGVETLTNTNGKPVLSVLTDYQFGYNGGNGWFRYLEFDEHDNKVYYSSYSPYAASLSADEKSFFDVNFLTGNSGNQGELELNFKERFAGMERSEQSATAGQWMRGEYHTHTGQSKDATESFMSLKNVLGTAFRNPSVLTGNQNSAAKTDNITSGSGFDFLMLADHLRKSKNNTDGSAGAYDTAFYKAVQLQIRDMEEMQITGQYTDKLMYSGFEWDMPGLDHASVGLLNADSDTVPVQGIHQFEWLYGSQKDGDDTSLFNNTANSGDYYDEQTRWGERKNASGSNGSVDTAVEAAEWVKDNYPDSFILPNHPSRHNGGSGQVTIEALRKLNDAAPNVVFGFEGMPGNQMDPSCELPASAIRAGADEMISVTGGVWDSLLSEGRRFYNFANSDFHFKISSNEKYSSGYWPSEFSENNIWVEPGEDGRLSFSDVVKGMRSGNSYSVKGNLISDLSFTVSQNGKTAAMGEDLTVAEGTPVDVTVKFKIPDRNNYQSLYQTNTGLNAGNTPNVDHVDLIMGHVTGKVDSANYNSTANTDAKIVKTFNKEALSVAKGNDGFYTLAFRTTADRSLYFRVRGLSSDAVDENGDPVTQERTVDNSSNAAKFDAINDYNYSHLSFYGNPVWVSTKAAAAVSFDANGGSGSMDAVTLAAGDSYTLPACTFAAPEGKRFKGWATRADGDVISGSSIEVSSDTTLYAIWTSIGGSSSGSGGSSVSTYTITVNGSKNGTVTSSHRTAAKGTAVTLTAVPDQGYVLDTLKAVDSKNQEIKLTEKNGKYTFTMPSDKVTISPIFRSETTASENPFTDIHAEDYYYDAVLWAAQKGVTGGTSDTTFTPDGACTRAQAVTFLWRAAGSPEPKTLSSFADIPADSYYAKAVAWAVENGVAKGVSDTLFAPDTACTRAQIVTFLWRAQQSPSAGSANPFADISTDAYYADAVLWAVENGVAKGMSSTAFAPDANCTRAQIVTFIYRCMK